MANPMHQFQVHKIGPKIEISGIDLSFTNASLFMLFSGITITLIWGRRRPPPPPPIYTDTQTFRRILECKAVWRKPNGYLVAQVPVMVFHFLF